MPKSKGRQRVQERSGYAPPPDAVAEIELTYPIEAYGGTVETIGIRRPRGRDLRQLDDIEGEQAQALHLVQVCAGLPKSAVDEMDLADFRAVQAVFEGFSKPSPKRSSEPTGEGAATDTSSGS